MLGRAPNVLDSRESIGIGNKGTVSGSYNAQGMTRILSAIDEHKGIIGIFIISSASICYGSKSLDMFSKKEENGFVNW